MKVVHIESGLGNQMLSYCEYLAIKKLNPEELCYIETIIYDIPECNDTICQWNGYELERIFGIKAPNIKEIFTETQWNNVICDIRKSKFWRKNWNYPVYITDALNRQGCRFENKRGNFEAVGSTLNGKENKSIKGKLKKTFLGYKLYKVQRRFMQKQILKENDFKNEIFIKNNEDIFTGQRLGFKYVNNDIEIIEDEIKSSFVFPCLSDSRNIEMSEIIKSNNSVAIHARRGDMLGYNYSYYKFGYFKRAVNYIKKSVDNPVFIFFCDPGSIEWCRVNEKIFGLNHQVDQILFVNWNKGKESFRDMQLMAMCKHNIITNSSFGWWGAYLNQNPNKITISPEIIINTTDHC